MQGVRVPLVTPRPLVSAVSTLYKYSVVKQSIFEKRDRGKRINTDTRQRYEVNIEIEIIRDNEHGEWTGEAKEITTSGKRRRRDRGVRVQVA